MEQNTARAQVTGWWRVLDLGLPVVAVVVFLMCVVALFRDDVPGWWVPSVLVMVLVGTGTRWLIESHRRRPVTGARLGPT